MVPPSIESTGVDQREAVAPVPNPNDAAGLAQVPEHTDASDPLENRRTRVHALQSRTRGHDSILPTSMSRQGSYQTPISRRAADGDIKENSRTRPAAVAGTTAAGDQGHASDSQCTGAICQSSSTGLPRRVPTFLHLAVGTPWLLMLLIVIVYVESILSYWRRY